MLRALEILIPVKLLASLAWGVLGALAWILLAASFSAVSSASEAFVGTSGADAGALPIRFRDGVDGTGEGHSDHEVIVDAVVSPTIVAPLSAFEGVAEILSADGLETRVGDFAYAGIQLQFSP